MVLIFNNKSQSYLWYRLIVAKTLRSRIFDITIVDIDSIDAIWPWPGM